MYSTQRGWVESDEILFQLKVEQDEARWDECELEARQAYSKEMSDYFFKLGEDGCQDAYIRVLEKDIDPYGVEPTDYQDAVVIKAMAKFHEEAKEEVIEKYASILFDNEAELIEY